VRTRYSAPAARAAFEHALEDAGLPDKAFYSPPEVERIADEFSFVSPGRGDRIVMLLRREAAAAANGIAESSG
jgi:hypothetical protein